MNTEAEINTVRSFMRSDQYKRRTFKTIKSHFRGVPDDQLRRLLISAGAVAKTGSDETELWGLLPKNDTEERSAVSAVREIFHGLTDFLKTVTGFLLAVGALVGAVLALIQYYPTPKIDCSNPKTQEEWTECANQ
ncbi:MAG: hypothetical protein AAF468_03170 [Pseudomonadota bacterium]